MQHIKHNSYHTLIFPTCIWEKKSQGSNQGKHTHTHTSNPLLARRSIGLTSQRTNWPYTSIKKQRTQNPPNNEGVYIRCFGKMPFVFLDVFRYFQWGLIFRNLLSSPKKKHKINFCKVGRLSRLL